MSCWEQQHKDLAYRIYVTDALKMITENTARVSQGQYQQQRFIDLVTPKKEETRTAEEIIKQVLSGLEEKGGETT